MKIGFIESTLKITVILKIHSLDAYFYPSETVKS